MRTTIDPGIDRPTIFLLDHIVYSHVQNLGGQPLDLDLSLMLPLQNNGEMRRIFGNNQPEERPDATTAPQAAKPAAPKRPVILWFNGNASAASTRTARWRISSSWPKPGTPWLSCRCAAAHRGICRHSSSMPRPRSAFCGQMQASTIWTRSASAWPGAVQAA